MTHRVALITASIVAITTSCFAEPGYDPAPTIHDAAKPREISIHDEDRGKDLLLTVRAPADAIGPCALVIFSHGAGGSGDAFEHLSVSLAQRGYVVVHPWHSDSIALATRNGEPPLDPGRGLDQIVSRVSIPDRIADIRLIIRSTDAIANALGAGFLIDPARVGLAGHSAGAMTTQAAAGVSFTPQRRARAARAISVPIPGISAFAVISGQGTTAPSLNENSWAEIDRPMLVVAGSRDTSPVSKEIPPASRRHPYEFAPADGLKFLLYIEGATHDSYQGSVNAQFLREEKPENAEWIERVTTLSVVALMDAYIRRDPDAERWLKAGAVREIPGGILEWRAK